MKIDENKILFGFLAEYRNVKELYHAAEEVRDSGLSKWDTHSPFPIHGMDKAMGLGRSRLSYFVFVIGSCGFLTAFLLQYLTQVVMYPTVVQGKPTNIFTIPAFFPVLFETTVLFSAFAAVFGILIFSFLPRWHHPLFNSEKFQKFSDDKFFISIEARDVEFDREKTLDLLEKSGASSVEPVYDED